VSDKITISLTGLEARALLASACELTGWEGPPIFPWGMTGRERAALVRARDKLVRGVPPALPPRQNGRR